MSVVRVGVDGDGNREGAPELVKGILFRVLSMRTIPAAGNGESCLGPNLHQYIFQIHLC